MSQYDIDFFIVRIRTDDDERCFRKSIDKQPMSLPLYLLKSKISSSLHSVIHRSYVQRSPEEQSYYSLSFLYTFSLKIKLHTVCTVPIFMSRRLSVQILSVHLKLSLRFSFVLYTARRRCRAGTSTETKPKDETHQNFGPSIPS